MSLGKVSVAIEAQMASFESDMGRAARIAEKEFKKIERDAKRTQEQMKRVGKVIGLALVAGAAAATVALKGAINAMDGMSKAAQRANMPTEDFSRLAYAGKLADVSMEDLQGSLGKLAKAQADSLKSTSAQAKVFQALGISAKNADGSLRATGEVFKDFADRFKEMRGSPEIVAAGMQLFGKSFQNLIPLLKDGSQGLRDTADEADRFGFTLSERAGKDAEAFNDELSRIGIIAGGVGRQIAADLLPQLKEGAERFRKLADSGDLARNAVTLLSAGLSAGVGILEGYTNAVNRTSIAIGTMVAMRAGMMEVLQNAASFGMADGSLVGGMKSAQAGMAQGQAELDALIARQNKAGEPRVLMSGRDAMPESMFKGPAQMSIAEEAAAIKAARERAEAIRKALGDAEKAGGGTAKRKADVEALTAAQKAAAAWGVEQAAIEEEWAQQAVDRHNRTVDAWKRESDMAADRAQDFADVNGAIAEQIELLGMSAQAQEIYNNLKAAGVTAESEWGKEIAANTEQLQAAREQAAFMADVQFGLADAFVEMATGAKSAKDAFGDFADAMFARALQFVADKAIQAMFDSFNGTGQAGSGGSSGGGFDWGGLIGSFFGGGRANGGPVSGGSFYEVGENNRPELLAVQGKQYLIPGNQGNVTPIRGGGGAFTQVIHQNYAAPNDPRTRDQMAAKVAYETQRAMARNR